MTNESTFQRIIRKTGRKPIQCKCVQCKKQCSVAPCLGTPDDIEKIVDAGHGDKILASAWQAGIMMKVTKETVPMFQAAHTKDGCIFFKDGLCSLHDSGLKPTEGKLSHHSTSPDNFVAKKSISWNVAKEWMDPNNLETIKRLEQKLNKSL